MAAAAVAHGGALRACRALSSTCSIDEQPGQGISIARQVGGHLRRRRHLVVRRHGRAAPLALGGGLRLGLGVGDRLRRLVHRQLQSPRRDLRIPVPVGHRSRCCSRRPCSRPCATRAPGASRTGGCTATPGPTRSSARRASFFTGITFLLAWLIAGLFDLIGIDLLKDLLRKSWFNWMLAGFAFGAAVGLLRERDRLVGTLQRLVMVVLVGACAGARGRAGAVPALDAVHRP